MGSRNDGLPLRGCDVHGEPPSHVDPHGASAPFQPRVTVLLAVKNGEQNVCEAVESILAQTFTDCEFLIVDDGSTNGTSLGRNILLSNDL
jgi:hypothetical protein